MPIEKFDHKSAPEQHSQPTNWFEAAYDGAASKVKSGADKTVTMVKDHPVEAAIVAGVAVVGAYALIKGKADFRIISSDAKTVAKAGAADLNGAKAAFESPALQRKTIDGAVIPDVARPL
ncbi:MAG: hypothetical protein C0508_27340, partial [Cyanobacteria bacterium PR.023]|nr:hypothetical protein [Cyanobacteria bacterium PR.023]